MKKLLALLLALMLPLCAAAETYHATFNVAIDDAVFSACIKDLLRRFQEDPSLWTEHLALFVKSLAPRAKELIQMIREKFPSYREMGSHYLKEKRSIDTFAYLSLTAEIVVQELHQLLQLDYTTCIQEFHQAILDACQEIGRAHV